MHLLVPCQGSGSPFMGENGSCLCVMDVKQLLVKRPLHCLSASVCFCLRIHHMCVCVCVCEIILNTCTDGKYNRVARMYFLWPPGNFGHIWEEFLMSWNVSQHTLAKGCGPVNGQSWQPAANRSLYSSVILQLCNKGISSIRSNNRLAAHEPIPSVFWPTCYWEMTCFPKLHHEAGMINGLKSDKRIWSGLLFPAYFNHVVMKWI